MAPLQQQGFDDRQTGLAGHSASRWSVTCVALLVLFSALMNYVGEHAWGFGPQTFILLLFLCALLLATPVILRLLERIPFLRYRLPTPLLVGVFLLASTGLLGFHVREFVRGTSDPQVKDRLIDIGANTFYANEIFFVHGRNPYTTRSQLAHDVAGGAHIDTTGGVTTMYGIRYSYGYPYFPMMFASFAPFQMIVREYSAIRIGNLFFLLCTAAGVSWVTYRLSERSTRTLAATAGLALFLSATTLGSELMILGVTDMVIAFFAVAGLVMLTYRSFAAAGVAFGFALGCKLLPGALILIVVLVWLVMNRLHLGSFLTGLLVTAACLLLPFVLWDVQGFFSATVLYYLTHHATGDNTSLWYFLPEGLQTPFLIVGGVLILLAPVYQSRIKNHDLGFAITIAFVAYVLFVSFNKMTHLNYLWGVYPLGVISLVVQMSPDFLKPRRVVSLSDAP
ncbi:MAG: hypothetical protein HW407_495 [Bacteroidetes bacterium]|nr:hypothetical protein [Bacteroidota bacterium]